MPEPPANSDDGAAMKVPPLLFPKSIDRVCLEVFLAQVAGEAALFAASQRQARDSKKPAVAEVTLGVSAGGHKKRSSIAADMRQRCACFVLSAV